MFQWWCQSPKTESKSSVTESPSSRKPPVSFLNDTIKEDKQRGSLTLHVSNSSSHSIASPSKLSPGESTKAGQQSQWMYEEKKQELEFTNDEVILMRNRNEWSKKERGNKVKASWGAWGQPKASDYQIRSKTYLETKLKVPSNPLVFDTVMVDAFMGDSPVTHVASRPFSWFQKNRPKSGFTFVHTIIVKSLGCSVTSYHWCKDKSLLPKLFLDFIEKDDNYRNCRLKMIPKIVNGPWLIKKSVQNVPVLVGKKLELTYYQDKDYIECDMLCDSSYLASTIISFARPFAESLTVELLWTIEGRSQDELPEWIFAGVMFESVKFSKFNKVVFNEQNNPVGLLKQVQATNSDGELKEVSIIDSSL